MYILRVVKQVLFKLVLWSFPLSSNEEIHELVILANKIDWAELELKLSKFYSSTEGAPAKSIRMLSALEILKYYYCLSDKKLIERCKGDYYIQYFIGLAEFTPGFICCDPSTLSRFRKRLGKDGALEIFKLSIEIHGKAAKKKTMFMDSTVQPKNIRFPTDIKLAREVIEYAWKTADYMGIKYRTKYYHLVKKVMKNVNFTKGKKREMTVTESLATLRRIGLELLRELKRKIDPRLLAEEEVQKLFANFNKALTQKKDDHDKIYSISEPQTCCIAKGKLGVMFEFGVKVNFTMTKDGIITSIVVPVKNTHDSKLIDDNLIEIDKLIGYSPEKLVCDRGYRGRSIVEGVNIITPENNLHNLEEEEKRQFTTMFNNRSSIEQMISHLKNDFRLGVNYLGGELGDQINPIYASTAYNFSLYVRKEKQRLKRKKYAIDPNASKKSKRGKRKTNRPTKVFPFKLPEPQPLLKLF
jgi:IS5 family transposase